MPHADVLPQLTAITDRIAQATAASGREPGSVELLLATKTVPPERILPALRAGYTLMGENRVQELVEKADALSVVPHRAHFIGHLQRNKINQVLRYADCVQSMDRVDLVEAVAKRVPEGNEPLEVLVQVNTSGEESKFGVAPDAVEPVLEAIAAQPRLVLKGFMTIGLFSDVEPEVRRSYSLLRDIRDRILASGEAAYAQAHTLSMGMSGDLEWAIDEGATMVRVGTAIFGKRPTTDADYWPGAPGVDRGTIHPA